MDWRNTYIDTLAIKVLVEFVIKKISSRIHTIKYMTTALWPVRFQPPDIGKGPPVVIFPYTPVKLETRVIWPIGISDPTLSSRPESNKWLSWSNHTEQTPVALKISVARRVTLIPITPRVQFCPKSTRYLNGWETQCIATMLMQSHTRIKVLRIYSQFGIILFTH